ncbi:MAG: DNA gyrase subunit A, partial [Phycisphaerales bacterium]|nr:DNA gyrase subunit A [Phycisphaerales bacterium]
DGLKPSQRRILKAMYDLKLWPGKKHLKCAKIAGDTSGNYHPHGESVIYPTLVGMAQKWKMRVPLIQPQGNFGSIEGDPPAAMRYTEARLAHAATDLLADLEYDTVDHQPNYDDRLTEPLVLPGKFPNLLINGGIGIAVGMATSLPPHNPVEIFDAIVRVIEDPDIELADLMLDVTDDEGNVVRHGVKGPDFPTGGVIFGRRGIQEAYATGRGRIKLRGVCHVEEPRKDRYQIVIDAIPYNLSQNLLVERIVDAVKDERIKDIADVRNESGRQAQTRIVVELKRGAEPSVVENQLFQFTPLQQTFSMINIALVNRQPRTLSLKEMIQHHIDHRVDVIRRRTSYLLREARKKAHKLEGQIYAVCDLDEVIALIRSSRTREEAIRKLMDRRFRIPPGHAYASQIPQRLLDQATSAEGAGGVLLTRVQAEQIGSLRLIQLVGLEIESLVSEYASLVVEIEGYEAILADHERVLALIKDDCAEMRQRYASNRLTALEDGDSEIDLESLIQEHDVAVTISHQGYAKRMPLDTYRAQGRGGRGIRASDSKDDDFIEHVFVSSTHDYLLSFTDTGRVFKLRVFEMPEMSRTSRGRPMINLVDLRENEKTCAYLATDDFEAASKYHTFVTRQGIVKRTPLKDYRNVHKGGLIAVGLKDDDTLLTVLMTSGTDDLMLVTAGGSAIRFNEQDVRLMGRPAAGVRGIGLSGDDEVVGAIAIPMTPDDDGDLMTTDPALSLLTISQNGYGKRTPVDEYRVQPEAGKPRSQSRGGKGRADIKATRRNGPSVAALGVIEDDDVVVVTRGGLLVRMPASSISTIGRGTQGVRVVNLKDGDAVISATRVDASKTDEED